MLSFLCLGRMGRSESSGGVWVGRWPIQGPMATYLREAIANSAGGRVSGQTLHGGSPLSTSARSTKTDPAWTNATTVDYSGSPSTQPKLALMVNVMILAHTSLHICTSYSYAERISHLLLKVAHLLMLRLLVCFYFLGMQM